MFFRFVDWYYKFMKFLLTALLFLLMVPVCLQIFSSYIGFIPRYIWTEEMARFCFIWIILIGSIVAVREGTHFSVDLLPQPKTKRSQGLWNMWVDLNIFLVALVFMFWGKSFIQSSLEQTSEMAGLPMVYIYSAWPLAGVSWTLFLIDNTIKNVKLIRSKD